MVKIPSDSTGELEIAAGHVVSQVTGSDVTRVDQIPRGVMTFKYAVKLFSGEKYIVRFYPSSRSFIVNYEPDILQRCAETAIPTPLVIADSRGGPKAPLEYIIYKMIDGIPLSEVYGELSNATRIEIAKQLVSYFEMFSSISMTGFGDPVDAYRGSFDTWPDFVEKSFAEGLDAGRRHGILSEQIIERLEQITWVFDILPAQPRSALSWGDISTENILIDEHNRIIALLDFEGALAAEPLMTLGYCHARSFGTGYFESIIDALPVQLSRVQWRLLKLYSVLRALRIIKFASTPLPTGQPRMKIESFLPGFLTSIQDLLLEKNSNDKEKIQ